MCEILVLAAVVVFLTMVVLCQCRIEFKFKLNWFNHLLFSMDVCLRGRLHSLLVQLSNVCVSIRYFNFQCSNLAHNRGLLRTYTYTDSLLPLPFSVKPILYESCNNTNMNLCLHAYSYTSVAKWKPRSPSFTLPSL